MPRPAWFDDLFSLRQPVSPSWAQVLAGTCLMGLAFAWFIATIGAVGASAPIVISGGAAQPW